MDASELFSPIVLVKEYTLSKIADAIREKNGTEDKYLPSEMATAIANIEGKDEAKEAEFIKCIERQSGYSLNIPEGVAQIGLNCFYNDTNIKSIVFPESVKSIKDGAFWGCTSLATISLNSVEEIGENSFRDCTSLTNLILNKCRQVSGTYAFRGCSKLASLDAPEMVYINSYAFHSCSALTTVNLPNITELGSNIFESCTSLKTIYIPSCCETIWGSGSGASLFRGCSKELRIYCGATKKPANWGVMWNYNASTGGEYTTIWGVTPEQYEAIVNG